MNTPDLDGVRAETGESRPGEFLLQVAHTADVDRAVLAKAREMLDIAFDGEMTEHDWEHCLGGMHAIAWQGDAVVGHASVIQRRLFHRGEALRTGYVEGVAVHPDWQRHGIAGRMMEALERVIANAYEIGALGATDEAVNLYEHRGWVRWRGATSALTPTGVVRTPDEDACIYVFPLGRALEFGDEITCDWRDGDAW